MSNSLYGTTFLGATSAYARPYIPSGKDFFELFLLAQLPALANAKRDGVHTKKIETGILDSADINAFATLYKGVPVIALYKGLIDAVREISVPLSKAVTELLGREVKSDNLASLALAFIIEHEYAHLSNGHVGWMVENRSISRFIEARGTNTDNQDALNSQSLEMDADSCAASRMVSWALSIVQNGFGGHPGTELLTDYKSALISTLASTAVIFYLFEGLSSQPTDFEQLSHPPAIARLNYVLGVHHRMFATVDDRMTEEEAKSICWVTILAVEKVFSKRPDINNNRVSRKETLLYYWGEPRLYGRVLDNWTLLEEGLQRHAWCDLKKIQKSSINQ